MVVLEIKQLKPKQEIKSLILVKHYLQIKEESKL